MVNNMKQIIKQIISINIINTIGKKQLILMINHIRQYVIM